MRKKWKVILGTTLLVAVCLSMSACTSSDDADEQKDKVNTEQDVTEDAKDDVSSMSDTESIDDDDETWEGEESDGALIEDPVEEEIIGEDDVE